MAGKTTMEGKRRRLEEQRTGSHGWLQWGPYLSERAWGTVREDYSADGNAWDFLPHDHARSRAYRWSDDGLAGISDDRQLLCLALALWNGRDPFLKERAFGLTGPQGNRPDPAPLHMLPTLWFRNTWSWKAGAARPKLRAETAPLGAAGELLPATRKRRPSALRLPPVTHRPARRSGSGRREGTRRTGQAARTREPGQTP